MADAKAAYIVAYNSLQGLGWLVCLVQLLLGGGSPEERWAAASPTARLFQLVSAMEILHAATGLVRSSPANAFVQWFGRSNVLFLVVSALPELHGHPAAPLMLGCWAVSEVIRYPWYALTAVDACPPALTWLRYTAFIPLYPVGVVSELVLLYAALPLLRQRDMYNIPLPNPVNWGFDYVWFVRGGMCAYPFLWWQLYSTLLSQRARKLGGGSSRAAGGRAGAGKDS